MATSHQLLDDALVTISGQGTHRLVSLCEVFAALSQGRDISFPQLQKHQAHAWHAFLTQVAASVVVRQTPRELPKTAALWRAALLELSDGDSGAWALVCDDIHRPAFMQSPLPKTGKLSELKNTLDTPDALDYLLTAKNFDLKCARVSAATPELWLYALITRQTMSGFDGAKNYGIARMNGGLSNRPCVSLARDRRWVTRFARDTRVWVEVRDELMREHGYRSKHPVLLWLLPWDGALSLERTDLDPFFVECCRRVRLIEHNGQLLARTGTSNVPRIDLKNFSGDTGDIWTPTKLDSKTGRAALTVPFGGFTYRRMHDLLWSGDWTKGAALKARAEDGDDPLVIAETMVRGQGKTEGFYTREIRVPGKVAGSMFGEPGATQELAARSDQQLALAKDIQSKVLKPALLMYLQNGQELPDLRDDRASPWLQRMSRKIDDVFFSQLFGNLELTIEKASARWRDALRQLAIEVFEQAIGEMPVPLARRFKARAKAARVLYGALKKQKFPAPPKETS